MSLLVGKNSSNSSLIATAMDHASIVSIINRYFLPAIGSIKHVARKTIPAYDIEFTGQGTSDDPYKLVQMPSEFNGWVLADGKAYSKESFPQAWNIFADDESSDYFIVPYIDDFIKAKPNKSQYDQVMPSATIMNHCHKLDVNNKSTATGVIKNALSCYVSGGTYDIGLMYDGGNYDGKQNYAQIDKSNIKSFLDGGIYDSYAPVLHTGGGNGKTELKTFDVVIPENANFSGIQLNSAGIDGEIYPKHICIYAMVFIGVPLI